MRLKKLLDIAANGYEPDDPIQYDPKTFKVNGDTLAQFIIDELRETFSEDEVSTLCQLDTAIGAMNTADRELQNVIYAIETEKGIALTKVTNRKLSKQKLGKKK